MNFFLLMELGQGRNQDFFGRGGMVRQGVEVDFLIFLNLIMTIVAIYNVSNCNCDPEVLNTN